MIVYHSWAARNEFQASREKHKMETTIAALLKQASLAQRAMQNPAISFDKEIKMINWSKLPTGWSGWGSCREPRPGRCRWTTEG